MTGELVPNPTPRQVGEEHVLDIGNGIPALIDHGMLWALNTYALHPRGFEVRSDGLIVTLAGHGRQTIQWAEAQTDAADRRWRQFEQTLRHGMQYNNPGHWKGHSPGFNGKNADRSARNRATGRRVGG